MTETGSPKRIVVLGGYGVFGGKLAAALLRKNLFDVIVAGRSLEKAEDFCRIHGGRPVHLDSSAGDFQNSLAKLSPFVIVDAAGPFQSYQGGDYRVAEAALKAGSHYLDLSDDAEFTRGIDCLDESAKKRDLVLLSGVSSVPALSSTAVEALRPAFSRIDLIETTLLPGNKAPRGLSVIQAILAQAGHPLAVTRSGQIETLPGWSGLSRRKIGPAGEDGLPPRWSSFIGAPDLALFPKHFGAGTVLFRAGLELSVMHLGLWLLSWGVRLKLVRTLVPMARFLQLAANFLKPFGSDRGGMEVKLSGLNPQGAPMSKSWTLIANDGDGPQVPALAAEILCMRLMNGQVSPGARACLSEIELKEIEPAIAGLQVSCFEAADPKPTVFQEALGNQFNSLPMSVKALHTVFDRHRWTGEAKVSRGRSFLGNILCNLIGFPPARERTPVEVTIERRGGKEVWQRNFGGKIFKSVLSPRDRLGQGHVYECFGPMRFEIDLTRTGTRLCYPVSRGKVFGVPLPLWLLPVSEASEFELDGRFRFDVKISLPWFGDLVHYQGWLSPANAKQP
ncbi:SDR family oxidoreductase [uncultured Roseibium sp.]|uniref:SDR family oxidoreductase n=1 Tax=uncultured Roseibium sp. TaxID=1936171 RepID=UPI00262F1D53|nr:SDR family oxidoreductase [uncultured Roseibium sp.]